MVTRTPAYYRLRSTVRFLAYTALVLAVFLAPHALVAALGEAVNA